MMQLKDAHNAKDCDSEAKMNYIRGSNADIKLKPLCPNPITLMRASDDLTSWQSFNLAGDQRGGPGDSDFLPEVLHQHHGQGGCVDRCIHQ
eukprot:gene25013-32591_t